MNAVSWRAREQLPLQRATLQLTAHSATRGWRQCEPDFMSRRDACHCTLGFTLQCVYVEKCGYKCEDGGGIIDFLSFIVLVPD